MDFSQLLAVRSLQHPTREQLAPLLSLRSRSCHKAGGVGLLRRLGAASLPRSHPWDGREVLEGPGVGITLGMCSTRPGTLCVGSGHPRAAGACGQPAWDACHQQHLPTSPVPQLPGKGSGSQVRPSLGLSPVTLIRHEAPKPFHVHAVPQFPWSWSGGLALEGGTVPEAAKLLLPVRGCGAGMGLSEQAEGASRTILQDVSGPWGCRGWKVLPEPKEPLCESWKSPRTNRRGQKCSERRCERR